jgi:hypothetical protein
MVFPLDLFGALAPHGSIRIDVGHEEARHG